MGVPAAPAGVTGHRAGPRRGAEGAPRNLEGGTHPSTSPPPHPPPAPGRPPPVCPDTQLVGQPGTLSPGWWWPSPRPPRPPSGPAAAGAASWDVPQCKHTVTSPGGSPVPPDALCCSGSCPSRPLPCRGPQPARGCYADKERPGRLRAVVSRHLPPSAGFGGPWATPPAPRGCSLTRHLQAFRPGPPSPPVPDPSERLGFPPPVCPLCARASYTDKEDRYQ